MMPDSRPQKPLVSVVVPTKNASLTVEACLASIKDQDYPQLELIVVDNESSDGTELLAARYADVLFTGGPERSAQRNQGIGVAQGQWVLWIDADMVLRSDVVSSAMSAAEKVSADAVFIPEVTVGSGFWTACRTLERRCYEGEPLIEAPRLVRRSFFMSSGGFVPEVAGQEDAELRDRLMREGRTIARADTMIEHDEGRLTLRGVLGKRLYYGRSIPAYAASSPGAVRKQARATVTAYIRHRHLLAQQPGHALGMLFLRSLEAVAYTAGAMRAPRP